MALISSRGSENPWSQEAAQATWFIMAPVVVCSMDTNMTQVAAQTLAESAWPSIRRGAMDVNLDSVVGHREFCFHKLKIAAFETFEIINYLPS